LVFTALVELQETSTCSSLEELAVALGVAQLVEQKSMASIVPIG
jgi:hypothetical protein